MQLVEAQAESKDFSKQLQANTANVQATDAAWEQSQAALAVVKQVFTSCSKGVNSGLHRNQKCYKFQHHLLAILCKIPSHITLQLLCCKAQECVLTITRSLHHGKQHACMQGGPASMSLYEHSV